MDFWDSNRSLNSYQMAFQLNQTIYFIYRCARFYPPSWLVWTGLFYLTYTKTVIWVLSFVRKKLSNLPDSIVDHFLTIVQLEHQNRSAKVHNKINHTTVPALLTYSTSPKSREWWFIQITQWCYWRLLSLH